MSKATRHRAILQLAQHGPIASQEELQRALRRQGIRVGQATLSRDIRKLGLVKSGDGYAPASRQAPAEPLLPPAARLVREFVVDVRLAQNLLVLKTSVGSAQPVAAAIDAEASPDIVGTLAGDDTILVIAPDKKSSAMLAARIRGMLA